MTEQAFKCAVHDDHDGSCPGNEPHPKRATLRLHGHEVSQQQGVHEPDRTRVVGIERILADLEEPGRMDDASGSSGTPPTAYDLKPSLPCPHVLER